MISFEDKTVFLFSRLNPFDMHQPKFEMKFILKLPYLIYSCCYDNFFNFERIIKVWTGPTIHSNIKANGLFHFTGELIIKQL